jgi:hypothetical protein
MNPRVRGAEPDGVREVMRFIAGMRIAAGHGEAIQSEGGFLLAIRQKF